MANEKRLIWADDVYSLFDESGRANLHVADIDVLPRVDAVEVVHGRWVRGIAVPREDGGGHFYHCSECGDWYHDFVPNYCPNCGAKMDGDGNGV